MALTVSCFRRALLAGLVPILAQCKSIETNHPFSFTSVAGQAVDEKGTPRDVHVALVTNGGSTSLGTGEEDKGRFDFGQIQGAERNTTNGQVTLYACTADGLVAVLPAVNRKTQEERGHLRVVLHPGATVELGLDEAYADFRCRMIQSGARFQDFTLRRGQPAKIVVPPGTLKIELYTSPGDDEVVRERRELDVVAGTSTRVSFTLRSPTDPSLPGIDPTQVAGTVIGEDGLPRAAHVALIYPRGGSTSMEIPAGTFDFGALPPTHGSNARLESATLHAMTSDGLVAVRDLTQIGGEELHSLRVALQPGAKISLTLSGANPSLRCRMIHGGLTFQDFTLRTGTPLVMVAPSGALTIQLYSDEAGDHPVRAERTLDVAPGEIVPVAFRVDS
jgi:hypothetical protein